MLVHQQNVWFLSEDFTDYSHSSSVRKGKPGEDSGQNWMLDSIEAHLLCDGSYSLHANH